MADPTGTIAFATANELDQRLRLIASQLRGVVYQYRLRPDGTSCFPYASDGIRSIYGVEPAAVQRDAAAVFAVLHPDDHDRVVASIHESARTLRPWQLEYRTRMPDGRVRWLYGNSVPQLEPDGSVLWHGFITDVTEQKVRNDRLAASEATLAAFVAHAPAAVAMLDSQMRFLLWSRRWLTDHGLEQRELAGRSYYEVFPDTPARWRDAHRRALQGAVVRADRDSFVQPDGALAWLTWEIRPWYAADGSCGGIVVLTEDITARVVTEMALADQQSQFRTLVDNIPGVTYRMCCDDALALVFLSASVQALTGLSPHEFLPGRGRTLLDCVHPDDRAGVHQAIRTAVATGRGYEAEYRIVRADGSIRWVQDRGRITPREGNEAAWLDGFLLDVTERHETLLRLEEARALAESASLAKSEFLANTSHEIRTPMTAILGYAELLASDPELAADAALRSEYLDRIRQNGAHLLALLNDILDLSKIEAGKMTIEKVATSPRRLLAAVVEWMEVRARAKNLTLEVEWRGEAPQWMVTDPVRLRQILVNLVGNAIKFTSQGGVRIVATVLQEAAGPALSVAVVDTGIGMTEEQQRRLFLPFEQADQSTTRRFGGSGLGLRISQRFAEMLGGRIEARSSPGCGSTFTVVLPLGTIVEPPPSIEAEATATADPARVLRGARVLVVDDGPDNRTLVSAILRRAGATVAVAEHGRQALDLLLDGAGRSFDLVLLDMQMPVMDGFSTAREIRARGLRIPIVALTAHAMANDRERCLAAGCDDYASKPIDRPQLFSACARAMTRR